MSMISAIIPPAVIAPMPRIASSLCTAGLSRPSSSSPRSSSICSRLNNAICCALRRITRLVHRDSSGSLVVIVISCRTNSLRPLYSPPPMLSINSSSERSFPLTDLGRGGQKRENPLVFQHSRRALNLRELPAQRQVQIRRGLPKQLPQPVDLPG